MNTGIKIWSSPVPHERPTNVEVCFAIRQLAALPAPGYRSRGRQASPHSSEYPDGELIIRGEHSGYKRDAGVAGEESNPQQIPEER